MKKLLLLSSSLVICATSAHAEEVLKHKGSVEGGITLENGNSDTENYRGSLNLKSTYDIYENEFKADGSNTKQNKVRTSEEYNISNQLKALFSELEYGFTQFDFTENRYAGFNYRTSELVGIGHFFIKEEALKILGEVAVGARQTDYTRNQNDEKTTIGRISADIDWKINDHVSFDHRTDYTMGEDNNLTEIETGLKAFLNENLYVRASHKLEHNSETPSANVKNTDTKTFFTVGYEF